MELTRQQLGAALGVSLSTVRKYERLFQAWLNVEPGQRGKPEAQLYNEHDARVMRTIHALRQENVSYADMQAGALESALESGAYEFIPEPAPGAGDKSERALLVPVEQFARLAGAYEAQERELARLAQEVQDVRQAQLDAERRAAAGAAIAQERDRLLERLERLERQLEEERRRSFWDKFRRG